MAPTATLAPLSKWMTPKSVAANSTAADTGTPNSAAPSAYSFDSFMAWQLRYAC